MVLPPLVIVRFFLCKSLSSIVLPKSLKHIGINPFEGCKCHIKSISPYFKVKDNVLYNSDMSKLISYLSEETNFIVPSGVTSIGVRAFSDCKSLSSIVLPSGVTSIGDSAFSGYHSLQEIIIPLGSRAKFEKLLPIYKDKLISK